MTKGNQILFGAVQTLTTLVVTVGAIGPILSSIKGSLTGLSESSVTQIQLLATIAEQNRTVVQYVLSSTKEHHVDRSDDVELCYYNTPKLDTMEDVYGYLQHDSRWHSNPTIGSQIIHDIE